MRAGWQRLPVGHEYQRSHTLKSIRTKNGGHWPPFLFVSAPRMSRVKREDKASDQRPFGDDNTVVIRVDVVARTEGHPTEGHRHIQVTQAALLTLARVRA